MVQIFVEKRAFEAGHKFLWLKKSDGNRDRLNQVQSTF